MAPNPQKDSKIDKINKITLGPGLGRLPQVGVWLATGMECPTLVGMGVEWPPPGPLGSGSLKIQVWASDFSLLNLHTFTYTFKKMTPNPQKDSKINKIDNIAIWA